MSHLDWTLEPAANGGPEEAPAVRSVDEVRDREAGGGGDEPGTSHGESHPGPMGAQGARQKKMLEKLPRWEAELAAEVLLRRAKDKKIGVTRRKGRKRRRRRRKREARGGRRRI